MLIPWLHTGLLMYTGLPHKTGWKIFIWLWCIAGLSASLCAQVYTCSQCDQSEITGTPSPRYGTAGPSQTLPSLVDRSLQKPTSMLLGKWELPLTWHLSVHVTGTTLEHGPATESLHFSTKNSIWKCFPPFFSGDLSKDLDGWFLCVYHNNL